METGEGGNEAHTNGSGQSVNVVISDKAGKWLFACVVVLVLFIVWSTRSSVSSEHKAAEAIRASQNVEMNQALTMLWMQEAKATCDASGVTMPKLPVMAVRKN